MLFGNNLKCYFIPWSLCLGNHERKPQSIQNEVNIRNCFPVQEFEMNNIVFPTNLICISNTHTLRYNVALLFLLLESMFDGDVLLFVGLAKLGGN